MDLTWISYAHHESQFNHHYSDYCTTDYNFPYRRSRGGTRKVKTIPTLVGNRPPPRPATTQTPCLTQINCKDDQQCKFTLFNAQSVKNKIEYITSYIQDNDFDVVAITETFLQEADGIERKQLIPDGYSLHSMDWESGVKGGGVAILAKDGLCPKIIKTNKFSSFEVVTMSMCTNYGSLLLSCIYRPPDSSKYSPAFSIFLSDFTTFLETNLANKNHVITGDFNIHMNSSNAHTVLFNQLLETFELTQHVSAATHTHGNILDLVLSCKSDSALILEVCVGELISDHFAIEGYLSLQKPSRPKKEIHYRKIKDIDLESFKNNILNSELIRRPVTQDVNLLVEQYENTLKSILDSHAPVVKRSVKVQNREQWYDNEIHNQKVKCRRAERSWRKSNSTDDFKIYKEIKNMFNKTLVGKKTAHFSKLIKANEYNQKELFRIVQKLTNSKKENPLPDYTCKKELANDFSQFFKEKIDKIRSTFSNNANFLTLMFLMKIQI